MNENSSICPSGDLANVELWCLHLTDADAEIVENIEEINEKTE